MKIRQGFVSNSSSSSFILQFDRVPETIEEMKELIFPNRGENYLNQDMIAESLLSEVQHFFSQSKKDQKADIKNELRASHDWEVYNEFRHNSDWDARNKERDKRGDRDYKVLDKNKIYCVVNYSDNDGEFNSRMEHEGYFDNIVYKCISHH